MDVPEEDNAQKNKRQAIQAIMKDTTLSPQEKQLKIQQFMASGGTAVPPPAPAPAPPTTTAPQQQQAPLSLPVPTHYPRLLLLISRQTIDRDQKNQSVIETLIQSSGMGDPEVVDGSDPANMKRRDDLFAISGLHARYPQVFLLESATSKPQFLGDQQGIQDLNEKGKFTKNAILGIEEEKEEDDKENEPPVTEAPLNPDTGDGNSTNDTLSVAPKAPTPNGGGGNNSRSIDPAPKSRGLFCCFGKKNTNNNNSEGASTTTSAPRQQQQTNASVGAAAPRAGAVKSSSSNAPPPKQQTKASVGVGAPSPNSAGAVPANHHGGTSGNVPSPPPAGSNTPAAAAPAAAATQGPFGNAPLKKTPTNPPPAAAPATQSSTSPFGNAPLKKTPAPAAAGNNNKPTNPAAPFGNAPLKKTTSGAAARGPPNKTQQQQQGKNNYNNTKSKSGGGTKKKATSSSRPKSKATITKVDPSKSHPKGTWYTKTTFQRLFF